MVESANSAIIFDFDGTMADSFLVTLDILYGLTHKKPFEKEDISRLRGLSMEKLLLEMQVPWWQVFFLRRRLRRLMNSQMSEIQLVPGIVEAVKVLSKKHKLFILTSNSPENVTPILERFEVDSCFTNIYGDANPLYKAHRLGKLLRQNNISNDTAWYIGDEPEDLKAAKEVGINSVAVSWGYSNIHVLKSHNPDALVFNTDELLSLFDR